MLKVCLEVFLKRSREGGENIGTVVFEGLMHKRNCKNEFRRFSLVLNFTTRKTEWPGGFINVA